MTTDDVRTLGELLDALIRYAKVSTMSTGWDKSLQARKWDADKQIPALRAEILARYDTAAADAPDPERVMTAIDDARVDPNYAVGNATFNEGVEAARQAVRAALAPESDRSDG